MKKGGFLQRKTGLKRSGSSPETLFFKKVAQGEDNECWKWLAAKNNKGYGMFCLRGVNKLAHRLSYQFYKGEIPEGMFVCHSCDNPLCVNPQHLWLGTNQDNFNDMMKKGRGKLSNIHPAALGEKCGASKLKEKDVIKMRKLRHLKTYSELAKMFNCSVVNVFYVLSGRTWKHVNA